MHHTIFFIFTLLLLTISSTPTHGMESNVPKNTFDIFPPELRRKILYEQDPVVLKNAIDCMAQQPITITEDYRIKSVIIAGATIITSSNNYYHNGSIKIWDAYTGQHIHTLLTFTELKDEPFALAVHNNQIAVGFSDYTIKIWNMLNAYEHTETIVGEEPWSIRGSRVTSLAMDDNNKIIAGVGDTVKIFNIHSGQCLQTFKISNNLIETLATNGDYIGIESSDGLVKIFDYAGNCIHTFNHCVLALAMDKNTIIAASSKEVTAWDLNTKLRISHFIGCRNQAFFKSAHIDQGKIIVSDNSMSHCVGPIVKIMSITDGTVLHTFAGFKKNTGICSVGIRGDRAVAEFSDYTAKIWPLVTNLKGTSNDNPSLWIIEQSDPLQANFIRRASELTNQEKECIIAWPNNFNQIPEDESPEQRDGRIYFSLPVFVRDYLRDHLIIRK